MNPDAIIETYVNDVVRHLPRKQRRDVAFELRSLLTEELRGRAADAGREADDAMTLELLAAFGLPIDVADRYRPAGFTVIRPSEAPRFARVAIGGLVVLWGLTLFATFATPVDSSLPGSDWLSRLSVWWLSWGLGAFAWPGFLITFTLIASAISARRESSGQWVAPRAGSLDRDRVNRLAIVLFIALGLIGATIVIALPTIATWGSGLPQPVIEAFAFDPDFLAWRAPWVLVLWAATLAVGIAVLVAGRWSRRMRQISAAIDVFCIALLVWWIVAGPIFTSEYADSVTKLCLLLVLAFTVLDLVLNLRRSVTRGENLAYSL